MVETTDDLALYVLEASKSMGATYVFLGHDDGRAFELRDGVWVQVPRCEMRHPDG